MDPASYGLAAGRPGPANTGHTLALDDYNSPAADTVNIPDGTELVGKRIYGDITNLGEALYTDCEIVGGSHTPSGASGAVNGHNTRTGIAQFVRCTFAPRAERLNRDAIVGKQFELYACDISGGIDGVGIFSNITSSPGNECHVKVYGCWIHDMVGFYPDYRNGVSGATWHSDGSHMDCIQIQGGREIHILGNFCQAYGHKGDPTDVFPVNDWAMEAGYAQGSGIIVGNETGAGIDNTLVIEENWVMGGGAAIAGVGGGHTFILRNNRILRENSGTHPDHPFSHDGYWVRGISEAAGQTITGFTLGGQTNRWEDGPYAGNLISEPQDLGIHWNGP